mgnify:CR=1 FL=1
MPVKRLVHIVVFLIIFPFPLCRAGDTAMVSGTDTAVIGAFYPRLPEQEQIEKYLDERDFQYGKEYKPAAGEGFFQRLWESILKIVAQSFQAIRYLPLFLRILFIIACLVLLFNIATKTKLYRLFYEDIETGKPEFTVTDPLHEEYDFDEAVAHEASLGNYRNAIRLLHLKLLKELDRLEIIRISRDKTNRDYSREIGDERIRREFADLSGLYNQIWYGHYPLSVSEYESLAPQFLRFNDMLHVNHE